MKREIDRKIEAGQHNIWPGWAGATTTAIGYPHTFATFTTNAAPVANRYTATEILSNAGSTTLTK